MAMYRRLLLSLVALSAVGACKSKSSPSDKAEIVIGATLPLTGSESRIGGFFKEGYNLAFDEVNAQGGLDMGGKKRPLKLTLYDDTTNQATANSLADKL